MAASDPDPANLGVIAGGGALPRLIAEDRARRGAAYLVASLAGAADDWAGDHPHIRVGLGKFGALVAALDNAGCDAVVFAGGLRRPALSSVKLDWKAVRMLPRIACLMREGDDGLLRGIAAIFEEEGFRVLGAHEALGGLLAPPGALGAIAPSPEDLADIARGADIARRLGTLDVGQAAVIARGICLGTEAVGGTDALLQRIAAIPAVRRGGAPIPAGVLCKAPKPQQDRRVDLPAIGPLTFAGAKAAGLSGVAVEAGGVLLLGVEETIRAADQAGLFLYGWE